MREIPSISYVHDCVSAGEALAVPCPNGCGPSLLIEWITVASGIVIGHWLACARCRPAGAWSCSFCAELIEPDGMAIWAHMVGRHG